MQNRILIFRMKTQSIRCMRTPQRFLKDMDIDSMRFQTMRSRDICAGIMQDTGSAGEIPGIWSGRFISLQGNALFEYKADAGISEREQKSGSDP